MASKSNANKVANPKKAALQGLEKMHMLSQMGLPQGVLAPNARPDLVTLRSLGFSGSDANVISQASKSAPQFLKACYSAASMWTANAATISPSADSGDGKVHFTPANLNNKIHRAIEAKTTSKILKATFADESMFTHHAPLPQHPLFGDEGAANYTRLADSYGHSGLALFVYGEDMNSKVKPQVFPARQTRQASEAVARSHQLDPAQTLYIQQNPAVIDQGVFHNDVIAIGNENVFLFHEQAFYQQKKVIAQIRQNYTGSRPLHLIEVTDADLSVDEAVKSYIFNSQLVSLPNGGMALIAPSECQTIDAVARYLAALCQASNPINEVIYMDLKQSMQNGGGPACLRLRVALSQQELNAVNPNCLMTDTLYDRLTQWVNKHYRDRLVEADLADPSLMQESQQALDELTQIMNLGSVYEFQQ